MRRFTSSIFFEADTTDGGREPEIPRTTSFVFGAPQLVTSAFTCVFDALWTRYGRAMASQGGTHALTTWRHPRAMVVAAPHLLDRRSSRSERRQSTYRPRVSSTDAVALPKQATGGSNEAASGFSGMATYRSELENARHELAEGLDRVREQAALIDRLHKEGKPIEAALDLLAAMRATVTRIETHIRFLIETEGRQD